MLLMSPRMTKQQYMAWAIFQSRMAAAPDPVPIKGKYVEINIQTLYDIYIGMVPLLLLLVVSISYIL